jgi:molybdate transport system ATP-binding protein
METFVRIDQLNLKFRNKVVLANLSWQIKRGEQWLLNGASGSGKTSLAKAIAGLSAANGQVFINYDKLSPLPAAVLYVPQWFQFKDKQGSSNFYFQQRFNSADAENTITVWDSMLVYINKLVKPVQEAQAFLERFNLWHRKDASLIQLSSGEHKKLQLIKALLYAPQFLILDNPYTGLDIKSRAQLNICLDAGCAAGMQLLIISNDPVEPACINNYASLVNGQLLTGSKRLETAFTRSFDDYELPAFLSEAPATAVKFESVVDLKNVIITYGDKQILKDLSWRINIGEKWLLKGHNGSGKSTLISLLTGDNPQAYANEIYLFGKKRGTGESIWDIKKHIGFISPELQWYFEPTSTVFQAVASGLFDTSGLFRMLGAAQTGKVNELLALFDLTGEEDYLLTQLPLGKQRLAMLARAIIKNPPLLILDEPCQGLDEAQTSMFNNLVDLLCTTERSLIYVSHFESNLPKFLTHQLILEEGVAINNSTIIENEITA